MDDEGADIHPVQEWTKMQKSILLLCYIFCSKALRVGFNVVVIILALTCVLLRLHKTISTTPSIPQCPL